MGDASFSIGILLGFVVGIGLGTSIGIMIGKQQKPWSELSEKEKKLRITAIVLLGIIVVVLIVVFLSGLLSWSWL